MIWKDEIVEEVRRVREAYAAPRGSPQNRPVGVTSKPASPTLVRTFHLSRPNRLRNQTSV